jgi:hypothetical protein
MSSWCLRKTFLLFSGAWFPIRNMFWGPKCLLDHFDSDIDFCFDHGKFHVLFKHYHLNSSSILIPWKLPSVQKSYLKAPLCTRLLFDSFFLSRTVIWKLPVFVDCFSLCLMQQQGWGTGVKFVYYFLFTNLPKIKHGVLM